MGFEECADGCLGFARKRNTMAYDGKTGREKFIWLIWEILRKRRRYSENIIPYAEEIRAEFSD